MKSKESIESLVDIVAGSNHIDDQDILDIAEEIAPGKKVVVSLLFQLRETPFMTDELIEFYQKRIASESLKN